MVSPVKNALGVALVLVTGYWAYSAQTAEALAAFLSAAIGAIGYGLHLRRGVASKIQSTTQHGVSVKALVKPSYISDRIGVLKANIENVAGIEPSEFSGILSVFYISDRPLALKLICRKATRIPTEEEAENTLNSLYISDRPEGAKAIASIRAASNTSLKADGPDGPRP